MRKDEPVTKVCAEIGPRLRKVVVIGGVCAKNGPKLRKYKGILLILEFLFLERDKF